MTAVTVAQSRSRRPRLSIRPRGLSLVELLISLSIAAMLLTAAAVAFTVSADAVQDNDEFFRATQSARVSLHQILTQVRRGSVQTTAGSTWIRLTTATDDGSEGDDITYRYLPDTDQLTLETNDDPTDANHVLANNVTDMTFAVEQGTDYNNSPCVARVTVMIKVRVGGNQVTLSGSAAPRRNLRY